MNKLKKFLSSIGPGIFIVGYEVGTGSVTTIASSGETLIHLIRTKFGNLAAIVTILGLMITVISSVIGLSGFSSH